jgi:uncharacterized protein (UPF0332 family)
MEVMSRLKYAQLYLDDARLLFENKRLGSALSRLYYSSYQAMWAALGEPADGRIWKHLAIIRPFVNGHWFAPSHPVQAPGLLEQYRLPLRQLYTYRVKADYELQEFNEAVVEGMIKTVSEVMAIIISKRGA